MALWLGHLWMLRDWPLITKLRCICPFFSLPRFKFTSQPAHLFFNIRIRDTMFSSSMNQSKLKLKKLGVYNLNIAAQLVSFHKTVAGINNAGKYILVHGVDINDTLAAWHAKEK